MDMQLKLKRSKEDHMSRGILQTALRNNNVFSRPDAREFSGPAATSEQPTLSDLVLPGSGHKFSDEFACLLSVLCAGGESA
jgi:hypothetical protein